MFSRKCLTIMMGILLWLAIGSSLQVQAGWAYFFVVYDGHIYTLGEETLPDSQIGERLGEVTHYSDREGTYGGHFSNYLPQGSGYYTILHTPVEEAIAVQDTDGTYVRANYEAPYAGGSDNVSDVIIIASQEATFTPTPAQRQVRLLILLGVTTLVLASVALALRLNNRNKQE